jgi:hypothetical protein
MMYLVKITLLASLVFVGTVRAADVNDCLAAKMDEIRSKIESQTNNQYNRNLKLLGVDLTWYSVNRVDSEGNAAPVYDHPVAGVSFEYTYEVLGFDIPSDDTDGGVWMKVHVVGMYDLDESCKIIGQRSHSKDLTRSFEEQYENMKNEIKLKANL